MANQSYCRFRNTLGDLVDCSNAIDNEFGGVFIRDMFDVSNSAEDIEAYLETHDVDISIEEFVALRKLVLLCRDLGVNAPDQDD